MDRPLPWDCQSLQLLLDHLTDCGFNTSWVLLGSWLLVLRSGVGAINFLDVCWEIIIKAHPGGKNGPRPPSPSRTLSAPSRFRRRPRARSRLRSGLSTPSCSCCCSSSSSSSSSGSTSASASAYASSPSKPVQVGLGLSVGDSFCTSICRPAPIGLCPQSDNRGPAAFNLPTCITTTKLEIPAP